jgi:hypothetical protein
LVGIADDAKIIIAFGLELGALCCGKLGIRIGRDKAQREERFVDFVASEAKVCHGGVLQSLSIFRLPIIFRLSNGGNNHKAA